jgi:hypothetical protein
MEIKPSDNPREYNYLAYTIKFYNVVELGMGGPDTGLILINNIPIPKKYFGTNILFWKSYIIITQFKPYWVIPINGHFKLCIISLSSLEIIEFGKVEVLIMPFKIEGDILYYYNHINRENIYSVKLPI